MADAGPVKPSRTAFFPCAFALCEGGGAFLAAASLQKAARSGPPLTLRPLRGSPARRPPSTVWHRRGMGPLPETEDRSMAAIGYVTKQENGGFKGQLKTLSISPSLRWRMRVQRMALPLTPKSKFHRVL